MIYIKYIYEDIVTLGGQVATDVMLADGWFEYDGDIPQGTNFKLIDGVLQAYTPDVPVLTQIQIYKDYLTNTDHKMYSDYEVKTGEDLTAIQAQRKIARDFIRANDTTTPILPSDNTAPVVSAKPRSTKSINKRVITKET